MSGMAAEDFWRHEFERQRDEMIHRLEVQNTLGQAALKSMMLANGGAIISLLTFIGNKAGVHDAHALKVAFGLFGAGLFSSLFAYTGAYFSQGMFMQHAGFRMVDAQSKMGGGQPVEVPEKFDRWGKRLLYSAIASVIFSLLFFGAGIIASISGIL